MQSGEYLWVPRVGRGGLVRLGWAVRWLPQRTVMPLGKPLVARRECEQLARLAW